MFAEASVVPGAVFDFGLWVDVQEGTFFVAALPWKRQEARHRTVIECFTTWPINSDRSRRAELRTELGVEVALGHFGHVVLVEELALVALLAEASEPVFAHHRLLAADVTERTHAP